jgi:alpha-beta hydrolase superfamily lysophospholipase
MTKPSRRGQNFWFDSDGAFTGAAWYWPQEGAVRSTAVVIVPGIAHEERSMASGIVALAESLADAGLAALLFDLHGCSQSAGRLDEPGIGERWRANVRAAVGQVRAAGFARVIVVGVRLGATIAFDALADEPLAALIAWAPIVTGRRHVRELKVLQRTTDAEPKGSPALAIGGFSIPAPVLEHVAGLDLLQVSGLRAPRVLLVEEAAGLNAPWLARLAGQGARVEEQESTQIHPWLFGAGDQPESPGDDIERLARWCARPSSRSARAG